VTQDAFLSLLRLLATNLGTAAVAHGMISSGSTEALVGAIVALGGLGWSLYANHNTVKVSANSQAAAVAKNEATK
jgi:hypothetical protein